MTFDLQAIAHELRTQDNQYTADPIFIVQKFERTHGFDPDYCEDTVFLECEHEYDEADLEEWGLTEDEAREENGLTETGFKDDWVFVNAHFTRKSADSFIESNSHRFPKGLRVYVDSMHRCPEMIALRKMLMRDSVNGMLMALTDAKVALEAYRDNVNSAETWKHALGEVDNAIANALAAN